MPIILPNNIKPNGKPFTRQKSNFCRVYAFLTVLHFHELHPKYYPHLSHPKNLKLGIEGFKKAQKEWIRLAKDSPSLSVEVKQSDLEALDDNQESEASEERSIEFFMDQIVDPILMQYSEQAEFLPNRDRHTMQDVGDDFYPYLLGFQILPFSFQNLNAEQIEQCLLKYGPLVLTGDFYQDKNYEIAKLPGNLAAFDGETTIVEYRTAAVAAKDYVVIDAVPHGIVLVGIIKSKKGDFQACYIDPNDLRCIFNVSLGAFLKQLSADECAYYHPCGNVEYKHNKTKAKEWRDDFNRSGFWPQHKVCQHVEKNLSLLKRFTPSSEKISDVSYFFRSRLSTAHAQNVNVDDRPTVAGKRKFAQITLETSASGQSFEPTPFVA